MYEHRFGLHRKPFQSSSADLDFYETTRHREIFAAVLHALKSDMGVAVLTGPPGIGKTLTVEMLRRRLKVTGQTIVLRGGAVRTAPDLLTTLHRSLLKADVNSGRDTVVRLGTEAVHRWEVLDRLRQLSDFWGPIVVLLDDAHLVQTDVFAELHALLEEETDGKRVLRLLITGPLVLEEILARPEMTEIAQKIRTHVFLQSMSSIEAVDYLKQQVQNCGGSLAAMFETRAIERIIVAADGVPRCVNLLADESLVVCDELDRPIVSREIVDMALQRLQHLPYSWNVSAFEDLDDHTLQDDEDHQSLTVSVTTSKSNSSLSGVFEIGGDLTGTQNYDNRASTYEREATSGSTYGVCEVGVESSSVPQAEISNSLSDLTETGAHEVSVTEFEAVEFVANATSHTEDSTVSAEFEEDPEAEATECNFASVVEFGSDTTDRFDPPSRKESFGPVGHFESAATVSTSVPDNEQEPHHDVDMAFNSLERHLILAGGPDVDQYGDVNADVATAAESGQEFKDDSATAASTEDCLVLLENYARWEPPGKWHTGQLSSVRTKFIAPRANAKPVFDRYTWVELGRQVSVDQIHRQRGNDRLSQQVVWPPNLDGIAPAMSIPIIDLTEGLSTIKISHVAAQDLLSNTDSRNVGSFNDDKDVQNNDTETLRRNSDHDEFDSYEAADSVEEYDHAEQELNLPELPVLRPDRTIERIQSLLDTHECIGFSDLAPLTFDTDGLEAGDFNCPVDNAPLQTESVNVNADFLPDVSCVSLDYVANPHDVIAQDETASAETDDAAKEVADDVSAEYRIASESEDEVETGSHEHAEIPSTPWVGGMLLKTGGFPTFDKSDSTSPVVHECSDGTSTNTESLDSGPAEGDVLQMRSPVKSSETATSKSAATDVDARHRMFSLPIAVDDISLNVHTADGELDILSLDSEPISRAHGTSTESDDRSATGHGDVETNRETNPDQSVVPSDRESVEELSESETQQQVASQGYRPRLLEEARHRVVASSSVLLKSAAGAERLAGSAVGVWPTTGISNAAVETATGNADQQVTLDAHGAQQVRPRLSFANLFTRLRARRSEEETTS